MDNQINNNCSFLISHFWAAPSGSTVDNDPSGSEQHKAHALKLKVTNKCIGNATLITENSGEKLDAAHVRIKGMKRSEMCQGKPRFEGSNSQDACQLSESSGTFRADKNGALNSCVYR